MNENKLRDKYGRRVGGNIVAGVVVLLLLYLVYLVLEYYGLIEPYQGF